MDRNHRSEAAVKPHLVADCIPSCEIPDGVIPAFKQPKTHGCARTRRYHPCITDDRASGSVFSGYDYTTRPIGLVYNIECNRAKRCSLRAYFDPCGCNCNRPGLPLKLRASSYWVWIANGHLGGKSACKNRLTVYNASRRKITKHIVVAFEEKELHGCAGSGHNP